MITGSLSSKIISTNDLGRQRASYHEQRGCCGTAGYNAWVAQHQRDRICSPLYRNIPSVHDNWLAVFQDHFNLSFEHHTVVLGRQRASYHEQRGCCGTAGYNAWVAQHQRDRMGLNHSRVVRGEVHNATHGSTRVNETHLVRLCQGLVGRKSDGIQRGLHEPIRSRSQR
jgi:ribosomal protein L37E